MLSFVTSVILLSISFPSFFPLSPAVTQGAPAGVRKQDGFPINLEFREFFEPGAGEIKPTQKLLGLNGKRVRIIGFMAQLEAPPKGAFYLCNLPVYGDESGGGTADLPPEQILVIARSSKGRLFPYVAGSLEVTGILQIGTQQEDDGTVSMIRLLLDRPQTKTGSPKTRNQKPPFVKNVKNPASSAGTKYYKEN